MPVRAWAFAASLFFQEDTLERAQYLAESGRLEDAIRLLSSHARMEPRAPELAYLAELHAASGGLPQAATALERALELAPEQEGLRVTLGAILFELRRYEEASEELEIAVSRSPRSAVAHYYLAAVQRGLARLDLAEGTAERAIELAPPPSRAPLEAREPAPSIGSRHLLAEIRFELGKEVEPLLREVLAMEPELSATRYLLARSLQRRGRAQEAAEEFRRFDALKKAEAHLAPGLDLSRLGRREDAIGELRRAVEIYPEHARALFFLGRELLRAGRREEAQSFFDRVLALRPDAASEVARLDSPP